MTQARAVLRKRFFAGSPKTVGNTGAEVDKQLSEILELNLVDPEIPKLHRRALSEKARLIYAIGV